VSVPMSCRGAIRQNGQMVDHAQLQDMSAEQLRALAMELMCKRPANPSRGYAGASFQC